MAMLSSCRLLLLLTTLVVVVLSAVQWFFRSYSGSHVAESSAHLMMQPACCNHNPACMPLAS
jgi:hypothetical protein